MGFEELLAENDGRVDEVDFDGLKVTFCTRLEDPESEMDHLETGELSRYGEALRFWRVASSAQILADITFGQSGLVMHNPDKAVEATEQRRRAGYPIEGNRDLVIGEFLGDADMLLATASGHIKCSIGSLPRSDWVHFESLDSFFDQYFAADGDKPWA